MLSRGASASMSAFVNTSLLWNRSMDRQSMKTTFYRFKLKTWQINLAQYKYKRQSTTNMLLLIFRSWNHSTTITDWFTNICEHDKDGEQRTLLMMWRCTFSGSNGALVMTLYAFGAECEANIKALHTSVCRHSTFIKAPSEDVSMLRAANLHPKLVFVVNLHTLWIARAIPADRQWDAVSLHLSNWLISYNNWSTGKE